VTLLSLAAVTAAKSLDQNCTVVVPETTSAFMKDKIRAAGGEVITHGASWKEADDHVRELLARDVTGIYCSPFDDPDIWEGNSSMIDEIVEQMGNEGDTLDVIIASVGGGGLLCGIQQGLETHGLQAETTVVAVETEGADSLSESLKAGELVTLPAITSIATSLGARVVAKRAFDLARRRNVRSQVVSDKQAAVACCRLLDDERIAVEAACGASVAIIYEGLLKKLVPLTPESKVVLIVCGGEFSRVRTQDGWTEVLKMLQEATST
jgi:L-serine/L-threonine ammonia-lyase